MRKYGQWTEQEGTVFRTSGDNKELTITPPSSLTGASLTLTLPDVSGTTDTMISRTSTDTLTNKTLTSPVIASISNTGTLTLPTSTDTLVGRATTDTLTNKTIDGDDNTVQDLALSSLKTTASTGVFLQRDGSGVVIDSTKAVPTGDVVGTSDSQTLTGKTIDGDNNTVQDLALTSLKTSANLDVFVQRNGSGVVIDSAKSVPTGDVVGTSDAQTLSAKTLSDVAVDTADVSIAANSVAADAATILRITSGTGPINSLTGGSAGDVKLLVNELGSAVTIADNVGADGFVSGTGSDIVVSDDAVVKVVYNGTSSRWQVVGVSKTDVAVTTEGDTIIGDASGEAVRLPIGGSGSVLTSNGTTASWQTPAGTGDVTSAANITDNRLVRGDGGAKGIQESGITIDDSDNVTGIGTLTSSDDLNVGSGTLFVDVSGTSVVAGSASYTPSNPPNLAVVESGSGLSSHFGSTVATFVRNGVVGDAANISIIAGTSGSSNIYFGDSFDEDRGAISYDQGSDALQFNVAAAPAARWGSAGNPAFGRASVPSAASTIMTLHSVATNTNQEFIECFENSTNAISGGTALGGLREDGAGGIQTYNSSDRRIKTNIQALGAGLSVVTALNPVTYDLKRDNGRSGTGFVAQELHAVVPAAVATTDSGMGDDLPEGTSPWAISQTALIPYLVKAIKELSDKVDALEAQLGG